MTRIRRTIRKTNKDTTEKDMRRSISFFIAMHPKEAAGGRFCRYIDCKRRIKRYGYKKIKEGVYEVSGTGELSDNFSPR